MFYWKPWGNTQKCHQCHYSTEGDDIIHIVCRFRGSKGNSCCHPPGKSALIKFRDCMGKAILPNVKKWTRCFAVTYRNEESTWGNHESFSSLYSLAPCLLLKMTFLASISFFFLYPIFHFISQSLSSFFPDGIFLQSMLAYIFSNKEFQQGNTRLFIHLYCTWRITPSTIITTWIRSTFLWSEYWSVQSSVDSKKHQSAAQRAENKRQSGTSFTPRWALSHRYSCNKQRVIRPDRRPAKFWPLPRAQQLLTQADCQRHPERSTQICNQPTAVRDAPPSAPYSR